MRCIDEQEESGKIQEHMFAIMHVRRKQEAPDGIIQNRKTHAGISKSPPGPPKNAQAGQTFSVDLRVMPSENLDFRAFLKPLKIRIFQYRSPKSPPGPRKNWKIRLRGPAPDSARCAVVRRRDARTKAFRSTPLPCARVPQGA